MVGVASSAILACLHPLLRSSLSLCSPIPPVYPSHPTLFIGRAARAVCPSSSRPGGILVSPLCRVTFGLYARPNLPDRRPGPPFSTNPGDELRGSRGLLVAMETEPSSPNPRQPNTGFLSLGTHYFPSPRFSLSLYLLLEPFPPLRDPLPPTPSSSKPVVVVLQTAVIVVQVVVVPRVGIISDSSNSFLLASSSSSSSSFDAVRCFPCLFPPLLWFSFLVGKERGCNIDEEDFSVSLSLLSLLVRLIFA